MPSWARRAFCAALSALLFGFAWSPLSGGGPLGGDFHALVDVDSALAPGASPAGGDFHAPSIPGRLLSVHGTGGHPLPALSLAGVYRTAGLERAVPAVRLANLACLLAAGLGIAAFVRRVLSPWCGGDHAAAAGSTAALLFALHPLHAGALGGLPGHAGLLGLACGAWSAALFVSGRQERAPLRVGGALALAVLAGLASGVALALPFVLAGAEYASSRRYRPARARARTAATTLVIAAAAVNLDVLLRSAVRGRFEAPDLDAVRARLAALPESAEGLWTALERVGVLVLPIHAEVLPPAAFALAGALLLLALHPALKAARTAPRLWGWLAASWLGALLLLEVAAGGERVHVGDLTRAASLGAASAVLCAGLGVASTALSGLRRLVLPFAVGAGFAVLARSGATAVAEAGREMTALRADLEQARETFGRDADVILIDPPRRVLGVDVLGGALPWIAAPLFSPGAAGSPRLERGEIVRVLAASEPAFLALAREGELEGMRRRGTIVLLPPGGAPRGAPLRRALLLPEPQPTTEARSWFGEGRSPSGLDLETLSEGVLRVRARGTVDASRAPVVAWRASAPQAPEGRLFGAWISGGEVPVAVFDLSSSLSWRLGGRGRQLWPAEGWSLVGEAKVEPELPEPAPALAPQVEGGDWVFEPPPEGFRVLELGAESWSLALLGLETLAYREIAVVREASGALRAGGAQSLALELARETGEGLAWCLEHRADGVAFERARGR